MVIVTKCAILDNLSHTTKIASFSATNGNFVIKSTIILYFLSTSPLVSLFCFLFSNTNYISLYIFLHPSSLLATSNFLLPILLSYIFLHVLLPVCCDVTTSLLFLDLDFLAYKIFLLFNTNSLSIFYSFLLNTLTPAILFALLYLLPSHLFFLPFSTNSISSSPITTSIISYTHSSY